MDTTASQLQLESDKLTCSTEKQRTLMNIRGARLLFSKNIYCNENKVTPDDLDLHPSPAETERVNHVVAQWAGSILFTVLMSEHLPVHLNLPVRTYPPRCTLFQALVLGEDLEFFILTLYDSTEVKPNVVEEFTMRCARVLTYQLLNYCGEDFILLPCTLEMKRFNPDSLKEELDEQWDCATDFYSGPPKLKESYQQLLQAVLILATASEVPFFLDRSKDAGEALLVAEPDSDRVLRLAISHLTGEVATGRPPVTVHYMPTTAMISAVLEAARRLSYRQSVVIVSDVPRIADCVKKLATSASFQCYTEKDAKAKFVNEAPLDTTSPDTADSEVSCREPIACDVTASVSVPTTEKPGSTAGAPPRETGSSQRDFKQATPGTNQSDEQTLNQTAPWETVIRKATSEEELANLSSAFRHDLNVAKHIDSIPSETPQCSEPPADTVPTLKTADDPAPKGGMKRKEGPLEDVHELQASHSHMVCATSVEAQPNPEETPPPEKKLKTEETPPLEEEPNSISMSRDTKPGRWEPVKEKPEDVCIVAIDTPGFPDYPGLRLRLMGTDKLTEVSDFFVSMESSDSGFASHSSSGTTEEIR